MKEPERRREDFQGGTPIVLCDGQEWHFPRPRVVLVPVFDADGRVADLGGRRTFGRDYDDLLDDLAGADEPLDQLRALMALAADLLRRNYELGPGELATLLRYDGDDPANPEMWRRISAAAQGIDDGPKASPGGDEPA